MSETGDVGKDKTLKRWARMSLEDKNLCEVSRRAEFGALASRCDKVKRL
jgi:hypothetical protein